MPDKKSVVGQNNNELWRHLCPDEEKVWCAFPPSLSHMFFHFPFPEKKYQQNVHSWNERGKGKLMVSYFSKKKITMEKIILSAEGNFSLILYFNWQNTPWFLCESINIMVLSEIIRVKWNYLLWNNIIKITWAFLQPRFLLCHLWNNHFVHFFQSLKRLILLIILFIFNLCCTLSHIP